MNPEYISSKKYKMKIGKLARKNDSVKQSTSLLRCRCADYVCLCYRSYNFSKELCEEVVDILSKKYKFDAKEAMIYLLDK